jgi:hypothetical protein
VAVKSGTAKFPALLVDQFELRDFAEDRQRLAGRAGGNSEEGDESQRK